MNIPDNHKYMKLKNETILNKLKKCPQLLKSIKEIEQCYFGYMTGNSKDEVGPTPN